MSIFSKNTTLAQVASKTLPALCKEEELDEPFVRSAIENGTIVLLGNPSHKNLSPLLVGQPSRVKVNANIGTSPLRSTGQCELKKLDVALKAGADTIMDLSIAGDLRSIRMSMLENCPQPIGTVPLYSIAQRYIDKGKDPSLFTPEELFEEIEMQAEQGVDFMTLHCGFTARGAEWAQEQGSRALGVVSRGGSILARWMRANKKENPLLEQYDRVLNIARKHNVTLSLGDGLRPGAGSDAGDAAQWEEVLMLGRLAKQGLLEGVQCMVEGPGHVPMSEVAAQIRGIKRATNGAPLYVLGPLVIDTCPGYDHIAGAIGGAIAVKEGVDFLCYLTPAEHLSLPDSGDVKAGVMASRIAAQAGEVALGRPRALKKEKAMATARKKLDWKGMTEAAIDPEIVAEKRGEHANEDVCAMCGKFCSVKMVEADTSFS